MGQGDRRLPGLAVGTGAERTYPAGAIGQLTAAVHQAGARVAVHSTAPDPGQLVAAGADSIEHSLGLDEAAVKEMARRGTAWTPTLGALLALLEAPSLPPGRRRSLLWSGLADCISVLPSCPTRARAA